MNVPEEITISWQEIQMLLGERDVIIYQLQREVTELRGGLAELRRGLAELKEKDNG